MFVYVFPPTHPLQLTKTGTHHCVQRKIELASEPKLNPVLTLLMYIYTCLKKQRTSLWQNNKLDQDYEHTLICKFCLHCFHANYLLKDLTPSIFFFFAIFWELHCKPSSQIKNSHFYTKGKKILRNKNVYVLHMNRKLYTQVVKKNGQN